MPVLTLTQPVVTAPVPRKRWTVDEFHALYALPKFENRRMILVDGEILDMPAPNPAHDVSIGQAQDLLQGVFGAGYWVRVQMALVLNLKTDPIPDLAVVEGPKSRYASEHPTTAELVVEVANSSLTYDLGDKADLYAAGGIADYWVIDLVNRMLVVHRDPIVDAGSPFGHRYATRIELNESSSIAVSKVPSLTTNVVGFFPDKP